MSEPHLRAPDLIRGLAQNIKRSRIKSGTGADNQGTKT